MKKNLKILIVDDHPMIVEAYKSILSSSDISNEHKFEIDVADDCDKAISKINSSSESSEHYDILFLDIKLPPSSDGEIISGEGLAIYAKKLLPKARLVILTMFNESHRIHNILKTVNPDGLLIKNDLTSKEFVLAVDAIVNNPPYYSTTVMKFFRKQAANPEEHLLDDANRKILHYLSKGIKTKNLPNYVSLSLSAIEKRKIQMRALFELEKANDEELINSAKKRGFL